MVKKIALNIWVLRNKNLDGIGNVAVNTFSRLIANHQEIEFQLLCDKNFTEDYFNFPNVTKHFIFPPYRHPLLYVFYLEIVLPFVLKKLKSDLYIAPDGFLSLLSKCPQLPIICDINFEHQPKDLKLKNRMFYRFFFKRYAKKAKRIGTISEYSKKDIANYYNIDVNKIDNISCGINSGFAPLTNTQIATTKLKWSNGEDYFFFVGSMHPRKNILRLIEAFNLFKQKSNSKLKLLLGGSILWSNSEIEKVFNNSNYKSDIIFTGRLLDEDLKLILGTAFCLTFTPIFEGFGLPIVEAFEAGVPVICSNVTSMPEVAMNAALLVDPYSIDDIAQAMLKITNDNNLAAELIQKGFSQKKKFSWDNTAKLLWQSILKT